MKNDIIKEVVAEAITYMTAEQVNQLKVTLIVKFKGLEVAEMVTLPSVIVYDNDWILTRFRIDMIAKGLSPNTIEGYIGRIKSFLMETGLNYREVTGQHITDYLAIKQYKDHISQAYKSTIYRYMCAFWGWAYRKHHMDDDVSLDVDHIKQPQKKKDRLTDIEVDQCRAGCRNTRQRALFELMMSTGMRVAEISNANISDIDFHAGTIGVTGKGDKYRTCFLNDRVMIELNKYIKTRRDKNDALFVYPVTSSASGKRLPKSEIEDMSKWIGRKAHLKTTVHAYRKTFASITYQRTGDVLFVSQLLGHASTDVTIKCYLIQDIEDMKHKHRLAVA